MLFVQFKIIICNMDKKKRKSFVNDEVAHNF